MQTDRQRWNNLGRITEAKLRESNCSRAFQGSPGEVRSALIRTALCAFLASCASRNLNNLRVFSALLKFGVPDRVTLPSNGHSERSACITSTRAARAAGNTDATTATVISTN